MNTCPCGSKLVNVSPVFRNVHFPMTQQLKHQSLLMRRIQLHLRTHEL